MGWFIRNVDPAYGYELCNKCNDPANFAACGKEGAASAAKAGSFLSLKSEAVKSHGEKTSLHGNHAATTSEVEKHNTQQDDAAHATVKKQGLGASLSKKRITASTTAEIDADGSAKTVAKTTDSGDAFVHTLLTGTNTMCDRTKGKDKLSFADYKAWAEKSDDGNGMLKSFIQELSLKGWEAPNPNMEEKIT